ncbi:MAG: histidine kinase [Lachnospiraceae bacterium]|nr:histidine kinase [Lachnospiraceae bacterium]
MKNISWSQLNIILTIMIGVTLLLGIVGGIVYQSPKERVSIADVETLNEAWIVETNEEYDSATNLPCNLEVNTGDPISISRYLPEDMGSDYGIAFRSVYNAVQVKVGDTIIYQYGVDEKRPLVSSPVPNWNLVPIDSQYAGELITITQISEYGKYSGLFTTVKGGSRSALIFDHWCQQGWGLIGAVILLILLIGLLVVTTIIGIHKKLDLRYRYYVIFMLVVTLWSISGSQLLPLFTDNGFVFWLLHILTRMLIPIAYLMFLRGFAQKKRLVTAIDVGIGIAGIAYVAALVLQLLGLVEFAVTYDILGKLYSVGFLGYTVALMIGWLRYGRKELRVMAVANTLLSIAGIVNLFIRPNHLYQTEGAFWQISVVVYCFLLMAITVEVVIQQLNQKVDSVEGEYMSQRALAVTMMNPNFLFSALNTLLAMTKNGSRNSAKFVFAFSKYLRYNFDSVREDILIPFEEELGHISAYLELQQMRMPGLQVLIEDKFHDFQVPARSVEAIVENAVKHGIGKNENQGQVIVRSYERRDSYAIQIVDEGAGFDTDMLDRKETPTAMKTIRERLNQRIGAVVEVNSKIGKGTIVTIRVPKNKSDQVDDE